MASYAYEHDFPSRSEPPAPIDLEHERMLRIVDLMNQLHVDNRQPPASKLSIQELDVVVFDDRDLKKYCDPCPVCQRPFVKNEEATKMPCKHLFHSDCILPWLELHNTCPMCRFELPTVDPEYESRRLDRFLKEKYHSSSNGSAGSRSSDDGSVQRG